MADAYDGDDIEWFRKALQKADLAVVRLQDDVAGLKAQLAAERQKPCCPGCPDCLGIGVKYQITGLREDRDEARAEVGRLRALLRDARAIIERVDEDAHDAGYCIVCGLRTLPADSEVHGPPSEHCRHCAPENECRVRAFLKAVDA